MKIEMVNSMLRNMVTNLCEAGWAKTVVGKLLLGSNGQAHLNQWMKTENVEQPKNFGIKPITKIANLIGYEPHIVFLPSDQDEDHARSHEAEQYIDNINRHFVEELKQSMINCMQNSMEGVNMTASNKTPLDQVLDTMLDD